MRKRRLTGLALVIGLVALYITLYGGGAQGLRAAWGRLLHPQARGQEGRRASGTVKAREVVLSPQVGGQVASVAVRAGDRVQKGQALLTLDCTLYEAQRAVARAQVGVAKAALARARAGARPSQIAIAGAELAQAEAGREAARGNLADLQVLRADQQELDMNIAVAEAQVASEEARARAAVARKDAAEVTKGVLANVEGMLAHWSYPARKPSIPLSLQEADYDWWKAWTGVNAAVAGVEGQIAQLEYLRDLRAHPQALDAKIGAAQAALGQAEAAVEAAARKVDLLRAGASASEITALASQVQQAQAALEALGGQEKLYTLAAPNDGVVLSEVAHAGEVLGPGSTALVLGELDELTVSVYLPEKQVGWARVGQVVSVTVDSWPGETFHGQVTRIGDRPEYTPRNIATTEGRMLTYYEVEIRLADIGDKLKPGMPADVRFD